jgi:hypothetical protein
MKGRQFVTSYGPLYSKFFHAILSSVEEEDSVLTVHRSGIQAWATNRDEITVVSRDTVYCNWLLLRYFPLLTSDDFGVAERGDDS